MIPLKAAAEALAYEMAIVTLYLNLPETPTSVSGSDRRQTRRWFDAGVPLDVVETALLLGSLRRLIRPTDAPALAGIRSLAYFHPVVGELLDGPLPDGYRQYLRLKMQPFLDVNLPGAQSCTG